MIVISSGIEELPKMLEVVRKPQKRRLDDIKDQTKRDVENSRRTLYSRMDAESILERERGNL